MELIMKTWTVGLYAFVSVFLLLQYFTELFAFLPRD
jgi:hypothetical protein